MHRTVPQHWASDRSRTADIFHVEGICAGITMALDVCEREDTMLKLHQEVPYSLYSEVSTALEFLAKYAKWQEMGEMLNRAQRMQLLTFVYVGQDPQDHHNEFFYSWTR